MQCQATTKSGTQCSRKALPNSNYCWQHQNYNGNIANNTNLNQNPIKIENKDDFKVILTNEQPAGELQLMLDALQPGIMSNVVQLSGTLGNFSQTFAETNQRKLLRQWFSDIHVQTPFSEVLDKEIPLIWGLYQNRIANGPPKDLLEKAIKEGLNQDYFYAKVVPIKLSRAINYEDLKDPILLSKLNQGLQTTIIKNKCKSFLYNNYI